MSMVTLRLGVMRNGMGGCFKGLDPSKMNVDIGER